jgi:PhnB protein
MSARSPQAIGGSPVTIHLYVDNVDAFIERAVEAGATVVRPAENHFYGDRGGMLGDPYGHSWWIASHVEDVPLEEIRKRASALYG